MARKTKELAEVTRQCIIRAAREVFLARGVSKCSLEQIAAQANVTRGAVYWHFANKSELFNAMRQQVLLPMIDRMDDTLLAEDSTEPLLRIEQSMLDTIQLLDESIETRQIYEIMMIKCEYVDEFAVMLQQMISTCSGISEKLEFAYKRAQLLEQLNPGFDPEGLAMDTNLFFIGLLNMWIKDKERQFLSHSASALIKTHMRLRYRTS